MGAERDHVFVVPTALDLNRLQQVTPDASAPELLFVGRLIEHKHADLAIEAVRILTERGIDVHLGIVGVGPEEHRLRTQVKDLHLGARVTFYSLLESQLELWSLVRGCRVLLAPSTREGFGLAVAESLALGTPVVCAVHPENESSNLVSPETGSLVTALDPHALTDAAEYWLKNESIRSDRVSAFLAQHAELTVGGMSAAYAGIFRNSSGWSRVD